MTTIGERGDFVYEVKKTTYQEVNQVHANNRHIRILKGLDLYDTSSKTTGTIVFDDSNLRGGFAQVPNAVLYDPLLGANAKLCYTLLLSYAWQKDSCFPSQKTLARDMACTTRTIIKALQELQKFKLIRVERPGLGKPNIYHIRKLSDGYLPKQYVDKGGRA